MGFTPVVDLTDHLSISLLDTFNSAMSDILKLDWPFLHRDAHIETEPMVDGTNWAWMWEESVSFTLLGYVAAYGARPFGDRIDRLIVTSGGDRFTKTPMIIRHMLSIWGVLTCELEAEWPGTRHALMPHEAADDLVDAMVVSYEYVLPETVKEVTSIRHQERNITLKFEEEPYVRDICRLGDTPQVAIIRSSGTAVDRWPTLAQRDVTGLVVQVWPIPLEGYLLDYSYVYDQQPLVAETDTMTGIPDHIETLILDLAFAYTNQCGIGTRDAEDGLDLEDKAWNRIGVLRSSTIQPVATRSVR